MFKRMFLLALSLMIGTGPVFAQSAVVGSHVLNQAHQAAALSNGTTYVATRGIYVGDAAACAAALYMRDTASSVVFANLQPGVAYPFEIVKINATGTTCTAIIGLW